MNDKRITQKDVAELAGVSTSIVSYVINNGPRSVSEETKQRVWQAIETLNYRPDKYAQKLMREKWQSGQLHQFGVIIGGGVEHLQRPFYGAILAGIYQGARNTGEKLRFVQFFDDLHDPITFNQLTDQSEISGLILMAIDQAIKTKADETLLNKLLDRIDNVVCVEQKWGNLPAVVFDLQEAAYKAVSHLIGLGHQHIGYIGLNDRRVFGYQQAFFSQHIPINRELIYTLDLINDAVGGYDGASELLNCGHPPTALCAASDEVAIGILRYAHENNLSIPHDIALVSIDNVELSPYLTPALTTIDIPKHQMGEHAVRMLQERAQHPKSPAVAAVLPTELIIRESCGAKIKQISSPLFH